MFTDENERTWLEGLKEGDAVILRQGSSWNPYLTKHTVDKVTPTQIVIGGSRFRRKDGGRVGAAAYSYIMQPTAERLDAIKQRELLRDVEAVKWKACPTAVLEQVLAVVQAHYAEQAKAELAAAGMTEEV